MSFSPWYSSTPLQTPPPWSSVPVAPHKALPQTTHPPPSWVSSQTPHSSPGWLPSQTPPPSWVSSQTPGRPQDTPLPSHTNPGRGAPSTRPSTNRIAFGPVKSTENPAKFDSGDQDQPPKPPSVGYTSIGEFGLRTNLFLNAPEMVVFDLSSPKFGPMQYHPNESEPPTLEFLPVEELWHTATQPPTTALDIMCGPHFKWCIELRLVDTHRLVGRVPPPITVGDILVRIYQFMSQPMEEADWLGIPEDEAKEIRATCETRCNVLGGARRQEEKEKGPKKIDCFGGKVWFGGLDRFNPQGFKEIKTLKLTMWSGDRRFLF